MLVRVNSGASGIADYLETGRKRGREFDRDLIDARLVLDGDLVLTDALIDSIETAQEGDARYLHITLGFAERFTTAEVCGPGEVNLAVLKEVTDAYREQLMAAYDRNEYAWYAEAHIPKVTHELHESSGEYVERLPHVHVVLPMRNLEDGRYLNPLGHGQAVVNAGWAQGIQERVNARFGLRSPATSRRAAPHNPVAKHNPRFQPGTPKEIREMAARLLREGRAASFDELAECLAEYGEVRIRNGQQGEYINVKPSWAAKGINLKEFARPQFADAVAAARAAADSSAPAADFERLADEWVQRGSYEARYLTSANRRHYKAMSEPEKAAWLAGKIQQTRARLEARERQWEEGASAPGSDRPSEKHDERARDPARAGFEAAAAAWRAAHLQQSRAAEAARGQPAATLSRVRHLSSVPLVRDQRTAAVLLHPDAPDRLERRRAAGHEVRRSGARDRGAAGDSPRRQALTVAGSLRAAREPAEPDAARLKSDTSPAIVLEAAARLYGIDPARYEIGSGRDGTPRILHAERQYNLGDFFTKHLEAPWDTAKAILVDCYNATLSDGLPPPDRDLWRAFTEWRRRAFEERRAGADTARVRGRRALFAARDDYKRVKMNSQSLPRPQRVLAVAAARAARVVAELEARRAAQPGRRPSRNAEYRSFLTDLANSGNLAALGELRRAAPPDKEPFDGLTGTKGKPVLPLPTYKIDYTGKVTYFKEEQSIVADSAKGVAVLRRDAAAYETALRVAVARYGRNLTLRGDQVFIDNMLAAARQSGLDLTIRYADRPRVLPLVLRALTSDWARSAERY